MSWRDAARRLLPPLLADGFRGARQAMRARRAAAAEARGDFWRRIAGGVLAGHELHLPATGEGWIETMALGGYEPTFTAVLADAVRPGDVCYDLGGHVGYYALVMALRAGPGGAVHLFEPHPANAARAREHAARNANPAERAPIHVHECAVGGETGAAELLAAEGETVASTLAHLAGAQGVMDPGWRARFAGFGRREVKVWRLDDWRAATGAPPPDLVKLDVEGSELQALRGARETLESAHPVILAELHNAGLAAECGAFLGALGYTIDVVACGPSGDCTVRATHPAARRDPA